MSENADQFPEQKVALPGSNIILEPQQMSPLSVPLFEDKTLGSLFKEALESSNIAEQEALTMIRDIRDLLTKERNDKTEIEVMLLLGPLMKDFITEYSSQTESKVKIAQAIATILKTSSPQPSHVTQVNVNNTAEPNKPKGVLESEEFKNIDILKPSFNKEAKKKIEKSADEAIGDSESSIQIIHSPDYLEKK